MKTKTTKKHGHHNRPVIFDPVRRLLPSLDEMPHIENGTSWQYNLPPAMLHESVEVHLDEADDGSSDLYVSLTAHDENEPILRLSYLPEDDTVRVQVYAKTHGHRGEVTHTITAEVPGRTCQDCDGRGYAIYNGNEIQRCDTCQQYDTDEEAAAEVERLLADSGTRMLKVKPQRRPETADPKIVDAIKRAMCDLYEAETGKPGPSGVMAFRPSAEDYENVRNRIRGVYGRAPLCSEWIEAGYTCQCEA
jgi:hypothetical protein